MSCSALSSALAGALGGFAGGLIMSRLRLSPVGAVRLIILTTFTFIVAIVVILFLGCPPINMAGQLDQDDGRCIGVYSLSCSCSSIGHIMGFVRSLVRSSVPSPYVLEKQKA